MMSFRGGFGCIEWLKNMRVRSHSIFDVTLSISCKKSTGLYLTRSQATNQNRRNYAGTVVDMNQFPLYAVQRVNNPQLKVLFFVNVFV